jgi:tRNA 2-selenouridine synthase
VTAETTDYRRLFLTGAPLLDTRAPVEFARGSFPGAVNLPLLLDQERAAVGTCYKREGQQAAIALGHRLVQGAIKAERVAGWLDFARRHPDGYLYCWRGGLRSQICQSWLREAGCDYPRVSGGYKALRRFLLQTLVDLSGRQPLLVLAGRTGSAKTVLLAQSPHSVDLEALARHRGSAFGRRPGGQPSQIDFDSALAIALLRCHDKAPRRALLVEDESKLIGRVLLPLPWQAALKAAPRVLLEVPFDARVMHSCDNYVLGKLREWQHAVGAEAGFAAFADDLRSALAHIRRRLGEERHARVQPLLEQALARHAGGDAEPHRAWISILLREYYDPMYDYQLRQHAGGIVFRGPPAEVLAFVAGWQPP